MIGIGIDAVEVERFRAVVAKRPGFIDRVFSENERNDVAGRADPIPGLAARFAAKEAAMKALGVGLGEVSFHEIEVVRARSGAPSLVVHGRAQDRANHLQVEDFLVSLTHTAMMASAVVLADGSRPAAQA